MHSNKYLVSFLTVLALLVFLLALPALASNIHTTDPAIEAARGNQGNNYTLNKFGHNSDVNGAVEVISTTADYWRPVSASTIEFISADADDTAAGAGCQNICINGLDSSWNEVIECEDSNGVSASTATTATYFRVFRAWCDRTGTYGGTNEGLITLRISGAGATVAQIGLGSGQTEIAAYTVPAGFTCYGRTFQFATDETSSGVDGYFYGGFNVDDVSTPFSGAKRLMIHLASVSGNSSGFRISTVPYPLPEKTDITCEAGGGTNAEISCTFSAECLEN